MASSKQTGKDFESRVCYRLEGWQCPSRIVPASGGGSEKGDVKTEIGGIKFLIECKKTKGSQTWTLERSMLDKIKVQAEKEQMEPLLVFGMQYSPLYCILKLEDFVGLLNRTSELKLVEGD